MAGVNMTEVRLLKVPLENDYIHTFYFPSLAAQTSYFTGLSYKGALELSYQRKDNIIRFPASYDELVGYNYVMYKNAAYSNKWWYAFITDITYVDDGRTDIQIETDVIQTWLFDYNVKASFVEREHARDDSKAGLHTVPEAVELGEYICNSVNRKISLSAIYGNVIVGSTIDLTAEDYKSAPSIAGENYGGIYSGVKYYDIPKSYLPGILKKVAEAGKSESIVCMFAAPSDFVPTDAITGSTIREVSESNTARVIEWVSGTNETANKKPTKLDGYTPRNNKLLTYPYTYLLMSNNSGGAAIYHYEYFNSEDSTACDFKIHGVVTPGMSIRLIPQNYKGAAANNEEGLNLGKYPICCWTSDVYTNWLTQNSVNITASVLGGIGSMVGGIGLAASGVGAIAGAGAITSGIAAVGGAVGEIYSHSFQPPQAEGNINSGDVTYGSGNLTFTAYQMSIKREYAEIIDGYFDMYGYRVNRVKVPETAHRQRYWYTKTIDANIDGNVPVKDLQKIKDCYNRGITFWRYRDDIGNYPTTSDDNKAIYEPDDYTA